MSRDVTDEQGAMMELQNAITSKRSEAKLTFVEAYMMQSGLKMDEIELVEEDNIQRGFIRWYCRPRTSVLVAK
jgi:hypothetical protein